MDKEIKELMVEALEACEAWHIAEDQSLGTHQNRMDLCRYSEWITRKALAAVKGLPFDEPFQGVPRMLLCLKTFTPRISRIDEGQAKALVYALDKIGL